MAHQAPPPPPRHASLRLSARFITGALRTYLAEAFADPANIVEPALAGCVWTPDPRTTGLQVESATNWVPQLADFKPALVIRADERRTVPMGIADYHVGGELFDGQARFTTQVDGSHTIFAIAKGGPMAEALAEEVFYFLLEAARPLRQALCLQRLRVHGVSALAEVGPDAEPLCYAASVTVAYSRAHSWELRTQAPFLRRVSIEMVPEGGAS